MCRRIMLLAVAIFCSISVSAAVDTAGLRARLTSRYGANAVARGVYVGSELCLMCHNGTRMPDQSAWRATQHASSYIRPMVVWSLIPGKGVLANTTGKPVDDFLAGVDFNAIASPFDAYKPNAPKLAVLANGTYTITIGDLTMPVIYLLQAHDPLGRIGMMRVRRNDRTDRLGLIRIVGHLVPRDRREWTVRGMAPEAERVVIRLLV